MNTAHTFNARLISCQVTLQPYNDPGKPDKRFRTGYKRMPSYGVNKQVTFTLEYDPRFMRNTFWSFGLNGELGKYVPRIIDQISNKVEFISVKMLVDMPNKFEITGDIVVNYLGSYHTESSKI